MQLEARSRRAEEILRQHERDIYCRTDRVFAVLMLLQWAASVTSALCLSPMTWNGARPALHPHVTMALGFGGVLCSAPVFLAWRRPGQAVTRHVIAIAQVAFSSLLIHISGGRIETHFHVFGSLAFLAAYRDWTILAPATAVIAVDHLVRGMFWPETVFGVFTASPWRTFEHAGWVLFEDVFLIHTIRQSTAEMRLISHQTASLEQSHAELQSYSTRLSDSYERERAIIEGALDAVVRMNSNGRITGWNSQAEQLFGWTAEEALDRTVGELIIPPEVRDAHNAGLATYRETGVGSVLNKRLEVEGLHRDGRIFPVEIAVTPIRVGDEVSFCAFINEITARKLHEEELRKAKEQAEEANRTKSEFLANMSHEIRTPLNGILGFTELLIRGADGGDESERRDYVRTIRSSGKHLLQLINDILDLSKIEAGQLQVEITACSPHHLIAEVVSLLRPRAQEKGVNLDYRWDSQIPEFIQSDPHRFRQLLMNLVSNAVKFTESGGVNITARLDAAARPPRLRVEVADTGIGIADEQLEHIFQPFVQADNSVTRKYGGTGLGLAITKNICEALGGSLNVESRLGHGSKFAADICTGDLANVRLLECPPETAAGDIVDAREGSANLDGVRVLVADDGDTNRKLIQLFLSRQGANVATAENGELAYAAATANRFDVILMDMQMPVMDGYAATQKLRAVGCEQPIIALTAHAMLGDRKRCEEAGCSGYVAKPVNMDELVRVIRAAVPRRRTDREDVGLPASRADGRGSAIASTLPTDDPQIRELVAEFALSVPERIEAIQQALDGADFDAVAGMAHALKGAGGTAGFACLTEPSARLERAARDRQTVDAAKAVDELRSLQHRIVVLQDIASR